MGIFQPNCWNEFATTNDNILQINGIIVDSITVSGEIIPSEYVLFDITTPSLNLVSLKKKFVVFNMKSTSIDNISNMIEVLG